MNGVSQILSDLSRVARVNRVEFLSNGSLSELVSLPGIKSGFSTKDDVHDARVHHIVTGAQCDNEGGELCASVRFAPAVRVDQRKPVDSQARILEGVLGTANRKIRSRILRILDVLHSPADSIAVLRPSLRRQCAYLRNCRQTVRTQHHGPNLQGDHDASFTTAAKAWLQPVSHVGETNMIHKFRSLASSNALRSSTCASCAEQSRDAKRTDAFPHGHRCGASSPPLWLTSGTGCVSPPMPFVDGPLKEVLVDPADIFCDHLALCPLSKSDLSRNEPPRLSLANPDVIGPAPAEPNSLTLVGEIIVARCCTC